MAEVECKKPKKKKRQMVINMQHCGYPIVQNAVKAKGWKIADKTEPWDVGWSDNNQMIKQMQLMLTHPRQLQPVQKVNHFPNSKQLYRKDYLATNMNELQAISPSEFRFSPVSWRLPDDRDKLVAAMVRAKEDDEDRMYIVKPAAGLQGNGIQLTSDPLSANEVQEERKCVVQHYVLNPLLLGGFKFDMRMYVLVTCISPLKIYVYDDGLARLCTVPYRPPDAKNCKSSRMHLTNYAVNKGSKKFLKGADGSKRSIKSVLALLASQGYDSDRLWTNIIRIIVKTIIGVQPQIEESYKKLVPKGSLLSNKNSSCFEIWGFDVMADANLEAWLLEVNHAPSFKGGSAVDSRIKTGVITQALDLLVLSEKRKRILTQRVRKKWGEYMWEQALEKSRSVREARNGTLAGGASTTDLQSSIVNHWVRSASNGAKQKSNVEKPKTAGSKEFSAFKEVRSKGRMVARSKSGDFGNSVAHCMGRVGTNQLAESVDVPAHDSDDSEEENINCGHGDDANGYGDDANGHGDAANIDDSICLLQHMDHVVNHGEASDDAAADAGGVCKAGENAAEAVPGKARWGALASVIRRGVGADEAGAGSDDDGADDEDEDGGDRGDDVEEALAQSFAAFADAERQFALQPEREGWHHKAPVEASGDKYIRVYWHGCDEDRQKYAVALAVTNTAHERRRSTGTKEISRAADFAAHARRAGE
jgi:tubulin polyglutamylase TTLL6/13